MLSTDGTRYACRAPCFTYTALLRDDGSVEHLNNQDTLHNGKKLESAAAVASRLLMIGDHPALWTHLQLVFDKFDAADHGMRLIDVLRSDRMSVRTLMATSSPKVACLAKLREEGQQTLGLEVWLSIISKYNSIFSARS